MFGITQEEFEYLLSNEAQALIKKHINSEPTLLALKGVSTAVCKQIKYLQKAKHKLPEHYASFCIIPPLSYEQSSSSISSSSRKEQGNTFCDLTCGLGMDSFHLSKHFTKGVTLERDSLIASIAQENFKRLGADNIKVINTDSEQFITNYSGEPFDLIYVDPARRDNTQKVFLLEDCTPNILEILPRLKEISRKIIIKLSPRYDHSEALRVFGEKAIVKAVSIGDECKELIIEIDSCSEPLHNMEIDIFNKKGDNKHFTFNNLELTNNTSTPLEELNTYTHISIADVALRKMRCTDAYFNKYHAEQKPYHSGGLALWTSTPPSDVAAKTFSIKKIMEYKPKEFKKQKIKNATLLTHNFPYSPTQIMKDLNIKNSGKEKLLFTTIESNNYIIFI